MASNTTRKVFPQIDDIIGLAIDRLGTADLTLKPNSMTATAVTGAVA